MKEEYPKHLGSPGGKRILQYKDYPKRIKMISSEILDYFDSHNIPCEKVMTDENSYVTEGAITFLTHGRSTNAYQLRYCPPRLRYGRMLRFDIPSGIDMGDHLYFTSQGERAGVIIVEGSTDALAAYAHGYTGISLLGANLTEARAEMLKRILGLIATTEDNISRSRLPFVFIPDNDREGQQAVRRLTQYSVGLKVAQLPLGAKDLCDLEYDDRELFLQEVLND